VSAQARTGGRRGRARHGRRAAPALRGRLGRLPRAARAIAGMVGFAATVMGALFVLWPSLKPQAPPTDRGATFSHAQVEPDLSFGEYLDRIEQSRGPYGPADLARRGAYVEFDFSVRGYKDKELPLRWQLIDARTGAQLDHSRDLRIKPLVATDAGSWNVWIALPPRARRLYVQVQLYDDGGTVPIGRVRTPTFANRLRRPPPAGVAPRPAGRYPSAVDQ
jgi:hypothetical protein